VRPTHVSDPEQKLVLAVALTDDRQATEHDGVCSLFGSRQLAEDEAGHQRLDEDAETRLQDENEERRRALRLNHSEPVIIIIINKIIIFFHSLGIEYRSQIIIIIIIITTTMFMVLSS